MKKNYMKHYMKNRDQVNKLKSIKRNHLFMKNNLIILISRMKMQKVFMNKVNL